MSIVLERRGVPEQISKFLILVIYWYCCCYFILMLRIICYAIACSECRNLNFKDMT
jgi:hypothetical protein